MDVERSDRLELKNRQLHTQVQKVQRRVLVARSAMLKQEQRFRALQKKADALQDQARKLDKKREGVPVQSARKHWHRQATQVKRLRVAEGQVVQQKGDLARVKAELQACSKKLGGLKKQREIIAQEISRKKGQGVGKRLAQELEALCESSPSRGRGCSDMQSPQFLQTGLPAVSEKFTGDFSDTWSLESGVENDQSDECSASARVQFSGLFDAEPEQQELRQAHSTEMRGSQSSDSAAEFHGASGGQLESFVPESKLQSDAEGGYDGQSKRQGSHEEFLSEVEQARWWNHLGRSGADLLCRFRKNSSVRVRVHGNAEGGYQLELLASSERDRFRLMYQRRQLFDEFEQAGIRLKNVRVSVEGDPQLPG